MMYLSRTCVCTLAVSALGLVATPALAMRWEKGGALAVGSVYTDNFCLSNLNEKEKWIGTLTPELSLAGVGARNDVNLQASVQFNTLDDRQDDCPQGGATGNNKLSVAPRLRFDNSNELISRFLYLDLAAFAGQNRVNAYAPGDTLSGSSNVNTTYSYDISPYVNMPIGSKALAYLRYSYNDQRNSEDIVRDSTAERVQFDVGMLPEANSFSVGLAGDYSRVEYDETQRQLATESELSSARIRAAYNLSRSWQINGYVGQSWNDFITSSQGDIDGDMWDLGITWRPNERITIAAGSGEQFFGSTPRLAVEYRHKRSKVSLDYSRQLTYQRTLRGSDVIPVDPDTGLGDDFDFAGTPTTNTTQPILNEALTLSYSLRMRRTSLGLTGYHSEQTRSADLSESTFSRVSLDLGWEPSRSLGFESRFYWSAQKGDSLLDEELQPASSFRDSETVGLSLTAIRRFGSSVNLSAKYEFRDRQSNADLERDEYTENRVTLTLKYLF